MASPTRQDVIVHSRIPEIIANLQGRLDAGMEVGAKIIEGRARDRVPVRHGWLREAIHTDRGEGGYRVIAGDDRAFYGHLVEFGTTHSPPEPFLIPAFEESRDEAIGAVAASLRQL